MAMMSHLPTCRPGSAFAAPVHAAIDLGTNNCRLLLAAPGGPEGFRVLDSFSRIVRLGEGLGRTGSLATSAVDRALGALSACRDKLARRPIYAARAVATEACRRAANGADFLRRAESALGLPIEVISPREEAVLAMESCAPLMAQADRRILLFDIGGGSTEVAWVRTPREPGEQPSLLGYVSVPVGVVTVAEQAGALCDSRQGFAALVEEIASRLEPFNAVHCIRQEMRAGGVSLMGTSGTVTTLAGIALDLPRYSRPLVDGQVLGIDAADAALNRLLTLGREGMAAHPCIGPERMDFVLPGCAIYAAIRRTWPAPRLTVCDRGLREGMLLRMMRHGRPSTGRRGRDWPLARGVSAATH
ncbi:Ppx/GppA phosphatase family protein [Roseomonas gilardii]|uniref:Ppx/GppA phosphatase family protein n=1 Tax=Roseomonas gilardii TaxID=257708 RepID=UPI0011A8A2F1